MTSQFSSTSKSWRPRFYTIWAGQGLSLLGSRLVQFALVWWITTETGSATALAGATLCAVLPQVLLGPLAGALVDRHSRRMLIIVADLANALAIAWLAVVFYQGRVHLWHVYVTLVVRALGGVVHWPAMRAATSMLVPQEQLTRVGGMNQTLQGVANLFVPPLGAVAMAALPMQGVLAIDIVTAMLAVAPLLFVRIPDPPVASAGSTLWTDMRDGLKFVAGWRALILFACIGTFCNMLGGAAGSLRPLLITEHYGGGAMALGWMQSAVGIGALAGGLALSIWAARQQRMVVSMLALALDGLMILLVAILPQNAFWVALIAMFGIGFFEAVVLAMNGAIAQIIVPPDMQGRVFGLLGTVGGAAMPLALAVAGPVSDRVGVRAWWVGAGIMITLTACWALAMREVREIERDDAPVSVL